MQFKEKGYLEYVISRAKNWAEEVNRDVLLSGSNRTKNQTSLVSSFKFISVDNVLRKNNNQYWLITEHIPGCNGRTIIGCSKEMNLK